MAGSEQQTDTYDTGTSTCTSNFVGGINCTDDRGISRRTYTAATIIDTRTFDVIWSEQGKRGSVGAFAAFDFEAEADVVDEVIEEMSRDGIIPPKLDD